MKELDMNGMTRLIMYTFIVSSVSCILVLLLSGLVDMLPQPVSLALACLMFGTSFVSGCVLPCVALRDRTDMKTLPTLGIALTPRAEALRARLGASLVLLPVWGFAGPNKASETPYWRTTLCVLACCSGGGYLRPALDYRLL